MSFLAFTGLINFATSLSMGIYVFIKNPKSPLNRNYFLFNASIALYSIGYYYWQLASSIESAIPWFKLLFCGIVLINLSYLHFVSRLTESTDQRRKSLLFFWLISSFFLFLNFSSKLYQLFEPRHGWGYWPKPTHWFDLYILFWHWSTFIGFYWLWDAWKKSSHPKNNQIKSIIIACGVGYIGGATNWPMWYGIPIPPYLNIGISFYVALVGYAIVKHQLMNINLVFRYATIYSLLTFTLAIPIFTVGWITRSWVVSSLLGLATTVASPWLIMKVKEKLTSAVDQLPPFKKYADRISKLHFLEERILDCGSTDECTQATISSIADYFSVDSAHVLTWDASTRCFQPQAVFGSKKELPDELSLPPENELVLALKAERRILIREILERSGGEAEQKVAEIMRMLGAEITAPVLLNNRLVSIINMGPKPGQEMYNELDLGDLFRLARTQAQALRGLHLESEKQNYAKAWMRAEDKATRDPLTHLYNRSKIKDYLGEALEAASQRGVPVSVLLLDIDHFKKINDTFGHPAGDEVIKTLAGLIEASLGNPSPRKHAAGRLGGEEFLIVLNQTDKPGAADFAGKLLDQARKMELTVSPGKTIRFTVSIGVSSSPEDGSAPIDLIRTADELMYQAKESGRDRVAVAHNPKNKTPSEG